ncbi:MAG: cupin domain-containing protein [Pseudomonadota bacterium]
MKARHLLAAALIAVAASAGHAQTGAQQQPLPPPERPSDDQIRAARSLANTDWGKGLPAFSFALSKVPMTQYDGGAARQAGTYNFPVSKNIAGVYMTLEPGAIRELHWHADAAEWAYVIEGRSRITLTSPEGQVQIADVDAGGIWYFPRGWGHSIEGLGPNGTKFILVFNNGEFTEQSTFSITDWISNTPMSMLKEYLGWTDEQIERLPKKQVYISRAAPATPPIADARPRDSSAPPMPLTHVYQLRERKPTSVVAGNSLRLVSAREFPASFNMTGAIVRLEPGAMRGLHWHPNADEWQFVLTGTMELSVFASGGKAGLSRLDAGDVGYVPKGYGHALKNPSKDVPAEILIVFNAGDYQSIELDDWMATNPSNALADTFQVPPNLVDRLPRAPRKFAVP